MAIDAAGHTRFSGVPLLTRMSAIFEPVVKAHDAGARAFVSAAVIDHWLDSNMSVRKAVLASGIHVGKAKCPDPLDLTGDKRAICTVTINGQALHLAVYIDDQSVQWRQIEAVVSRDLLQKVLQGMYASETSPGGSGTVAVRCGTGVVVVRIGGELTCQILSGPIKRTVLFDVQDSNGRGQFRTMAAAPF